MEISIAAQTVVFFKAVLLGACLSVVYDILRVLRVLARARRGKTAVFDTIFCLVSGVSLFFFIIFAAKGEARIYIVIGAILGAVLYFMTLSKFVLRFGFGIAKVLSKCCYPLRRAFKKTTRSAKAYLRRPSMKTKFWINLKKHFNFFEK